MGDAIGLEATHLGGDKTLGRWQGIRDQDGLSTLHDLEETEEGFLLERLDGLLAMDAGGARSTGDSAVSALTLKGKVTAATDVPLLEGSALDWGFRQIANAVNVPVQVLDPAAGALR